MNDGYDKLAQFYDSFVTKNRNYDEIAKELAEMIGDKKDLLDIGIGTGLIVEHLLKMNPSYKITGIDTSESLLEQAQKRLGDNVELHCQSVSELESDRTFDVAYSRGGAWTFVRDRAETMLGSHLLNLEDIQKSFNAVAKHLKTGGRLIVSSSNAYGNNLVELEDSIVHERTATTEIVNNERYAILDYRFYKDKELLAKQILKLRLLSYNTVTLMLEKAGFVETSIEAEQYYIYEKK